MKKLILIMCLISVNAWGGEYDMKCKLIKNNCEDGYKKRCDNKEVVCIEYDYGELSCFKK